MKKLLALFLGLSLVLTGCSLFGGDKTDSTLTSARVLLAESPISFDPYSPVAIDRQYLHPIYERLVDFDDELQVEPQLAYTFGKIDEQTWQFKIRSEVRFHDGTALTLNQIKQTFETLQTKDYVHLNDLLGNIQTIEVAEPETITFKLKAPDAEFLRKLTQVPIISTTNIASLEDAPNGTGPYQLASKAEHQVNYKAFPNHWNKAPLIPEISYQALLDKDFRFETAVENEDVLAVVPFPVDLKGQLSGSDYEFKSQPDLTVSFFIWNPANSFWSQKTNRQKLLQVIPYEKMEILTSEQGTPAGQFLSTGVFGYNPELQPELLNLERRKELVKELGLEGQLLRFAVPPTLKAFGLQFEHELNEIGIKAEAYLIEHEDLFNKQQVEGVHLIFLGWRSDLGTGTNFLSTIFSAPKYNVANYSNSQVNQLLQELATTYEEQGRLAILQQVMSVISLEDPYGIPLFYGRLPHVVRTGYNVPVRLDGVVLVEAISK